MKELNYTVHRTFYCKIQRHLKFNYQYYNIRLILDGQKPLLCCQKQHKLTNLRRITTNCLLNVNLIKNAKVPLYTCWESQVFMFLFFVSKLKPSSAIVIMVMITEFIADSNIPTATIFHSQP